MWNVLYVEDDADSRDIVQLVFRSDRNALDIQCAVNCEQAVEHIMARRADLYLLDVSLPDGDGIQLCRSIRSFEPCKPIVFLSANAFELARWDAMAAGGYQYLVKPLDIRELRREIISLLTRRSPQHRSRPRSH